MSRQRRPASPSGRFPGERHQSARSPCRPRRRERSAEPLRAGEVREDDCQILIVRIVRVRTENPPWTANAGQETRSTPKTSAKTIKSETPPRQCISAHIPACIPRRKKTPTRHRPAPVFSTMPDHSKNPWHTPAWRQRSRPKHNKVQRKPALIHRKDRPPEREAATIREAHFRKRSSASCSAAEAAKIARRMPVRPSGEKNSMSKSPSRRKRKTPSAPERPFSSLQPPSVRQRIPAKATCCLLGELCGLPQRLVNHQTRDPKRAHGPFPHGGVSFRHSSSWRSQRSTRLPRASISRCSASVRPPRNAFRFELLRDGRQRRRTCAQFFQKPILRFAVRYHDPPPNYTATKDGYALLEQRDSSCSSLSGIWETTPDAERLSR